MVRHRQGEHTAYQSEPAALAGGSSRTCTDLLKEAEARRSFHDPTVSCNYVTSGDASTEARADCDCAYCLCVLLRRTS